MKRHYVIPGMAAVAALGLILSNCSKSRTEESEKTPVVDVADTVVDSVLVYKTYPGYLGANRSIDIVGRVNGSLLSQNFTSGDFVRKGQVLYTIESSQYVDAVNQAKAQLETAIATNQYATRQYAAMKKALESDAVSQMDVIQAESAMKESKASIENARAALRTAQTTLGYCTITAPASGHISSSRLDVGSYISGSGSPVVLTTIYEDDILAAVFSVEESQYIKMKDGNVPGIDFRHIPVSFTDSLPHSYYGALTYVAPTVNTQTGSVTLKVQIGNPYGELKNGMYAEIALPDRFLDKAVMVKDASVSTDQLGKYVYIVNDSDKVVYTPIQVGPVVRDSMRIVTSGLEGGERYVTKALLKVRDGMKVSPRLTK